MKLPGKMGRKSPLSRCCRYPGVMIVALLLLLAAGSWVRADWKKPREALERRVVVGDMRIYYTLQGENAFPFGVDPARRETEATRRLEALTAQLQRADEFYRKVLGLTPPLVGEIFRRQGVGSIDLHILRLEGKKGSAGDASIDYRYRHFPGREPALTITLSSSWQAENLTPAHELFHSYQYGYTYFKNGWYLEGMARSLENPFREGRPVKTSPLPGTEEQLAELQTLAYRADRFWNRLFYLCDPGCAGVPLGDDGSYLLPAGGFCGAELLREVLVQLGRADREAAREFGVDPLNWPEREQRAARNNPYLLLGLRRAMDRQCAPLDSRSELQLFHRLLKEPEDSVTGH